MMFQRTNRVLALTVCALALLTPAWRGLHAHEGDARRSRVTAETREGRLRIFEEVWEGVRARYYDPSLGGLDWHALGMKYRAAASDANGQDEFYAVLRRMLAHLRDPHTRVHPPGEGADWRRTRFVSIGLRLREIESQIVVYEVERGSEAERAGVRAGDLIVSIGGTHVSLLLSRALEEIHPAPPSAADTRASVRLRALSKLFDGPEGTRIALVSRGEDGRERRMNLLRRVVTREAALRVRRVGGTHVVDFNLFTQETAAALARALKTELKNTRALVIDLRENSGGDAEAMTDAASLILPPGRSLGRFNDRAGRITLEPRTRSTLLSTADCPAPFAGPIVILVGPRTASAAEVFAAALKESGRATSVVGERTCGCALGIRSRQTLPDGGTLDVSEMDYRTALGARIEGSGLTPDETIAPTRRALREGKDDALRRAIDILKLRRINNARTH